MIPRLTIKFDLPDEVANGFEQITNNLRKHVIRQSIRSALSPSRAALKTRVMAITRSSRQATGATFRAIDQKYGQNKTNPNRFYGLISVNRKYIEAAVPEKPLMYGSVSRYRQVAFGIRKKRVRPGDSEFVKRYPRQEVRSYYKRGLASPLKRRPSKYLHLIEFGFNRNKSNAHVIAWKRNMRISAASEIRSFPGYHMIEKAQRETEQQAIAIFRQKTLEHFRRILK